MSSGEFVHTLLNAEYAETFPNDGEQTLVDYSSSNTSKFDKSIHLNMYSDFLPRFLNYLQTDLETNLDFHVNNVKIEICFEVC